MTIRRTLLQECLIEQSINSVRLSVKVCQPACLLIPAGSRPHASPAQAAQEDAVGQWLMDSMFSFLARPRSAEQLLIVRKQPRPGYHLSFLVTAAHCQTHSPLRLVEAIEQLLEGLPAAFGFRLALSSHSRAVGQDYLRGFLPRRKAVAH